MISIKKIANYVAPPFESYVNTFLSHQFTVALSQDDFSEVTPLVSVGDSVKEGQVIARDIDSNCNIHSPVPGIIKDFVESPLPNGKNGKCILIQMEGEFSYLGKIQKKLKWNFLTAEQLIRCIAEKGIINTFSKPVPLAKQLRDKYEGRNIILRLYDYDPTCYTDTYISKKYLSQILEGISILASVFSPGAIYCLYDKALLLKDVGKDVNTIYSQNLLNFIPVNTTQYPCGGLGEIRQLIKKNMKRQIPYPITKNDLLLDCVTMLSIYEAVVLDEPLMSRFITVSGDALKESKIMKTKIGTPIYKLIEECGGLVETPGKIIINGTICGNAISDMHVPITKYVKSVTFLSEKVFADRRIFPCIHCGNCYRICPVNIKPNLIYEAYMKNPEISSYISEMASICTDCRLCNMNCPSRLPLYQAVEQVKRIGETKK